MIAARDELSPAQQAVYDSIVDGPRGASSPFPLADVTGNLVGPFDLMVRHPEIGGPLQALGSALRYETSLTARAREIVILTVARSTASEFERYAHRLVALRAQMSAAEVTALLEGRFRSEDPLEQAIQELAGSLLNSNAPSPRRAELTDQCVVETVALVGYYRLLAQLMGQFGIGVETVTPRTIRVPSGEDVLSVDLYSAPDPQAPLVLYLHGGGWVSGHRTEYAERFSALLERGISVASMDYRLATEAPYPAQREDIENVLNALGSEKRSVFLMGASAGATLAMLATTGGGLPLSGVIGLFGRYDLTAEGDLLRPSELYAVPSEITTALRDAAVPPLSQEQRTALLAGTAPQSLSPADLERLSPTSQLTSKTPPILLVHGTGDAVIDHRHSIRFAERAHRLGVRCELLLVPGANHEGPEFSSPLVSDTIADFILFSSPDSL